MAGDLFEAAAVERLRGRSPLAARLRPRSLNDIVGQQHLVGPGRPLRRLIEADRLSSVILWGPPGTGKTTLARFVVLTTARVFEELSAVTAGVKDVRGVMERAISLRTTIPAAGSPSSTALRKWLPRSTTSLPSKVLRPNCATA